MLGCDVHTEAEFFLTTPSPSSAKANQTISQVCPYDQVSLAILTSVGTPIIPSTPSVALPLSSRVLNSTRVIFPNAMTSRRPKDKPHNQAKVSEPFTTCFCSLISTFFLIFHHASVRLACSSIPRSLQTLPNPTCWPAWFPLYGALLLLLLLLLFTFYSQLERKCFPKHFLQRGSPTL